MTVQVKISNKTIHYIYYSLVILLFQVVKELKVIPSRCYSNTGLNTRLIKTNQINRTRLKINFLPFNGHAIQYNE